AQLTDGSFEGLQADYDEAGSPVLVGIRAGSGKPVPVDGMSDGTCDQLYLALRLASLETFLDQPDKEPLPLIADDLLIQFDDQRAAAALGALARLSQRTQVIFFTHHQHVVDLAVRHLDPGILFVHRLEGQLAEAGGKAT